VTSPAPSPSHLADLASASRRNSAGNPKTTISRAVDTSRVTALSVEFVAKPQEASRVEAAIPKAITGSLQDVTGFAGCLVMISDQEMRLVTVVTLWAGQDRAKLCRDNARWVHSLLAPYVDRCLRVQTLIACLPVSATMGPETNSAEPCFMKQEHSAEETVCIA
jgi:hypothetical protein